MFIYQDSSQSCVISMIFLLVHHKEYKTSFSNNIVTTYTFKLFIALNEKHTDTGCQTLRWARYMQILLSHAKTIKGCHEPK